MDPRARSIEQLEKDEDDDSYLGRQDGLGPLPPVTGLIRRESLDLFLEWEAWDGKWDPFQGRPWPTWWFHDARQIRLARRHLERPGDVHRKAEDWAQQVMRTFGPRAGRGETHG